MLRAEDWLRPVSGHWLWDSWPVAGADGMPAADGLWMALAAPAEGDPELRHARAHVRLLKRTGDAWEDRGRVLPEGFGPGSREWSGSALLEGARVRLFYTAAGRLDEAATTVEQRIVAVDGRLADGRIDGWSAPVEVIEAAGAHYARAAQASAMPGAILGFRDPGFFRDPADGSDHIIFTASDPAGPHPHSAVIGHALCESGGWRKLPPLASGAGLVSEMERPHLVWHQGAYLLFWSSHAHVFAPGPAGPTGLYGMIAGELDGPWRLLNGHGLVIANPPEEPAQCYGWWVTPDLAVNAFIDRVSRAFIGALAPELRLAREGDRIQPIG